MAEAVYKSLAHAAVFEMRERAAFHWIDNTTALSAMVNGFSSHPDMALIVCSHHASVNRAGLRIQYEWIPSEANVSDWPTRAEKLCLIPADATWIQVVLPTEAEFGAQWSAWSESVYGACGARVGQ